MADATIWQCWNCQAWVDSDDKGRPLGTAANLDLRRARDHMNRRLSEIFGNAADHPAYAGAAQHPNGSPEWIKARAIIKRTARARTYALLAERLGIEKSLCVVERFDLETCREAWRALRGITYDDVRNHAKGKP